MVWWRLLVCAGLAGASGYYSRIYRFRDGVLGARGAMRSRFFGLSLASLLTRSAITREKPPDARNTDRHRQAANRGGKAAGTCVPNSLN